MFFRQAKKLHLSEASGSTPSIATSAGANHTAMLTGMNSAMTTSISTAAPIQKPGSSVAPGSGVCPISTPRNIAPTVMKMIAAAISIATSEIANSSKPSLSSGVDLSLNPANRCATISSSLRSSSRQPSISPPINTGLSSAPAMLPSTGITISTNIMITNSTKHATHEPGASLNIRQPSPSQARPRPALTRRPSWIGCGGAGTLGALIAGGVKVPPNWPGSLGGGGSIDSFAGAQSAVAEVRAGKESPRRNRSGIVRVRAGAHPEPPLVEAVGIDPLR